MFWELDNKIIYKIKQLDNEVLRIIDKERKKNDQDFAIG
jgi:hypothetical protein